MGKIKTKLWVFFFALLAFLVPLGVVFAVEKAKQAEKVAQAQEGYLALNQAADQNRTQYYQNIEKYKSDLKQSMDDAKAKYDELLQNQPGIVAQHQKQVNQTTTVPITTQQTAPSSSKSSSSKSSSKSNSSSSAATSATTASAPAPKPSAPAPAPAPTPTTTTKTS